LQDLSLFGQLQLGSPHFDEKNWFCWQIIKKNNNNNIRHQYQTDLKYFTNNQFST